MGIRGPLRQHPARTANGGVPPIPENDIWIAALCRQHHLAVASRDGHLDRVRGLKRVAW